MSRMNVWRYNPTRDSSSTWWILGGVAATLVTLGVLSTRSAPAAIMPPNVPPPTPRPTPTQPPADMTFTPEEVREIGRSLIRQPANPTESSRTLYILQQQLRDLGYAITLVDGQDRQELRTQARRFAADNGLPANAAPIDIVRSVDAEYGRVFGERGYV